VFIFSLYEPDFISGIDIGEEGKDSVHWEKRENPLDGELGDGGFIID